MHGKESIPVISAQAQGNKRYQGAKYIKLSKTCVKKIWINLIIISVHKIDHLSADPKIQTVRG